MSTLQKTKRIRKAPVRPVSRVALSVAADFLENETRGQFFSVYFEKKDGTMRQMNCRRGVTAHLRGGKLGYEPANHNLLTVFDVQACGYRSIPTDHRLISFNYAGTTYVVA